MPDEITVDAEKFDKILGKMLAVKPVTKAEISARIKTDRDAKKAAAFEKYKAKRLARKLGQQP